ncbi:tetratricopeptide repeat protein [Thiomicrorhabdus sp. Kp2]|uniref:tetratricopeptide repeat protein n=1 Tax=Thiomicrorhabdus sp. Kp2 TaxID=1123518 RepID=UPI000417C73A|nr:tetratricopeptide repeat protein [Thiomicrorhabdus sp. Kp2]
MQALILILFLALTPQLGFAESPHNKETQDVNQLKEPMYNPFIERYVIDELKDLRADMMQMHVDLTKEVTNRDISLTTRAVSYVSDTVTYFFYLIAGISSVLVLLGWNSIRDIKEKVHDLADSKVNAVIDVYEQRLAKLEEELNNKSKGINNAHKQLIQHQDIHSLWLKAGQESLLSNRMSIYDQILEIDPYNTEALTYKADLALEMDEPQWAINLCNKALQIDPQNRHAFYQLAGAFALLNQPNEALENLERSLLGTDVSADEIISDPVFKDLLDNEEFKKLLNIEDKE